METVKIYNIGSNGKLIFILQADHQQTRTPNTHR